MYIMVRPLALVRFRPWHSISSHFPGSNTLCQPILSQRCRKLAQSSFNGATQPVDIKKEGLPVRPTTDRSTMADKSICMRRHGGSIFYSLYEMRYRIWVWSAPMLISALLVLTYTYRSSRLNSGQLYEYACFCLYFVVFIPVRGCGVCCLVNREALSEFMIERIRVGWPFCHHHLLGFEPTAR